MNGASREQITDTMDKLQLQRSRPVTFKILDMKSKESIGDTMKCVQNPVFAVAQYGKNNILIFGTPVTKNFGWNKHSSGCQVSFFISSLVK
jgi:hypothetical protein